MKYLCLGYYDEEKFNALPNEELQALVKKCRAHDAELLATGKVMLVGSLSMPQYWKLKKLAWRGRPRKPRSYS